MYRHRGCGQSKSRLSRQQSNIHKQCGDQRGDERGHKRLVWPFLNLLQYGS